VAEADPASLVVCDSGPLIHVDELGCLNLLRGFAEVQVPEAVWQEVHQHRPSALRRRSVRLNRVTTLPAPSPQLLQLTEAFLLGAGEFEALRLMHGNPSAIFLTDDAAARLVSQRLQYEVHGTVGVVVRAWRRRQRTRRQVLNLLRAIPARSTLFIEQRLLNAVIEQVRNA
jgi:predicted nucleic acid-binding protein